MPWARFLIIAEAFLDGIPKEMDEAAFVDGASDFTSLTRIYVAFQGTVKAF